MVEWIFLLLTNDEHHVKMCSQNGFKQHYHLLTCWFLPIGGNVSAQLISRRLCTQLSRLSQMQSSKMNLQITGH